MHSPPTSESKRLMKDLQNINERLSESFKMLASLKADLQLEEDADVPQSLLGYNGIGHLGQCFGGSIRKRKLTHDSQFVAPRERFAKHKWDNPSSSSSGIGQRVSMQLKLESNYSGIKRMLKLKQIFISYHQL